jgi:hypothetical protein
MCHSVYKTEINDHGNPLRWPRDTLCPQKLALTSPTSDGRSVGIVRSPTKVTEFSFSLYMSLERAYHIFTVELAMDRLCPRWIPRDLRMSRKESVSKSANEMLLLLNSTLTFCRP